MKPKGEVSIEATVHFEVRDKNGKVLRSGVSTKQLKEKDKCKMLKDSQNLSEK